MPGDIGARDKERPVIVDHSHTHIRGEWLLLFQDISRVWFWLATSLVLSLFKLHEAAVPLIYPVRPAWALSPRRHA